MPTGIYKRTKPGPFTGKHHTLEARTSISNNSKGKKQTEERKEKTRGEKNWNWQGGIAPLNKRIRISERYKQWRSDVFKRDNWTCQTCRERGCYLEAHHIKGLRELIKEYNIKTMEKALQCEELWDVNNGVTLCEECHSLTDNYKGKATHKKI